MVPGVNLQYHSAFLPSWRVRAPNYCRKVPQMTAEFQALKKMAFMPAKQFCPQGTAQSYRPQNAGSAWS